MITVKILSCRSAQRYAVRQRVIAAKRDLQDEYPGMELSISEVKDWAHIEPFTQILSAPSLVVNDQMVCEARFPTRAEVLAWLRGALQTNQNKNRILRVYRGSMYEKSDYPGLG